MPENWNFSHEDIFEGNLIIHSVETLLDAEPGSAVGATRVLEDRGLTVFTDTLSINGPLRMPGRNVFIHARQINCGPGAAIDVSGLAGEDFRVGDKIQPASFTPGTGGVDGAIGGQGGSGGTITIICESLIGPLVLAARGGDGGRGQDGGDGVRGEAGTAGADGVFLRIQGQPGGNGGRGGSAGRAGDGGPGGDAGTVRVRTIETRPPQLTFDLTGGRGGQPGEHGIPAAGGAGGPGGRNGEVIRVGSRQEGNEVFRFTGTNAAAGQTGPTGEVPSTLASMGIDGVDRSTDTDANFGTLTDAELGSFASITQLLMLLHRLELDYLNSAFDETARALFWIERLTRDTPGTNAPASMRRTVPPAVTEWAALRDRAVSLILQLQVGLDYYGHPRNFVPLVAVGVYRETVDRLSEIAEAIQAQTRLFRTSLDDENRNLDMVNQSLASARGLIRALEDERAAISENQIPQARGTIDQLLEALQEQQAALLVPRQNFQAAVMQQANNCDFFDVLNFVTAVFTASQGALGNVRSIVSSVERFSSTARNFRGLVSTLEVVNGQLGEIRQAYNRVRDRLATLDSDTKLVMLDRDFEEALRPFLDLPEAQNLRQLMRAYVDTARARNQKIMDLASLELRVRELDSQIAQRREEIARLNALRVVSEDPALVEYVTFVENQLVRAKQDLIKILYLEHRALDYWSVRLTDFSIESDQTVEDLRAVHGRFLTAEALAATDRNSADQSFGPDGPGSQQIEPISVSLTRDEMPEEFERFRRTGRLVFTIPDDHPAFQLGFAAITVRHVDVRVPGVRITSDRLSIRITHSGDAVFRDTQNRRVNFSHNPRFIIVARNLVSDRLISGNNNLGGEPGTFAFISPFTTWTMEILDRFNQGQTPDLTQVERVDLTFSGFFLPFTI